MRTRYSPADRATTAAFGLVTPVFRRAPSPGALSRTAKRTEWAGGADCSGKHGLYKLCKQREKKTRDHAPCSAPVMRFACESFESRLMLRLRRVETCK